MCSKSYDPLIEGSPLICPVCFTPVTSTELTEHFYRHFTDEGIRIRDIGMTDLEYATFKEAATGVTSANLREDAEE